MAREHSTSGFARPSDDVHRTSPRQGLAAAQSRAHLHIRAEQLSCASPVRRGSAWLSRPRPSGHLPPAELPPRREHPVEWLRTVVRGAEVHRYLRGWGHASGQVRSEHAKPSPLQRGVDTRPDEYALNGRAAASVKCFSAGVPRIPHHPNVDISLHPGPQRR